MHNVNNNSVWYYIYILYIYSKYRNIGPNTSTFQCLNGFVRGSCPVRGPFSCTWKSCCGIISMVGEHGIWRDRVGLLCGSFSATSSTTNEDAHIGKPSMSFNISCLLDFKSSLGSIWSMPNCLDCYDGSTWLPPMALATDTYSYLLSLEGLFCPGYVCLILLHLPFPFEHVRTRSNNFGGMV